MKRKNKQNVSSPFLSDNLKKLLTDKSPFVIREAYSTCRTRLMFTQRGEEHPVFAMTSPEPGDGKTISVINTAISFAKAGKKTLVIDMDLRNSSVHRYFQNGEKKSSSGLSEYLAGLKNEVIIKPTQFENLFLLPAGFTPPNPGELLSSEKLRTVIETLRSEFDYIFIDTPPVNLVSDAALLAHICTGYIIVARVGKTRSADLRRAINALKMVDGHISGVLMNDVSGEGRHYSSYYDYHKSRYYYYHGYYGHDKAQSLDESGTAVRIEAPKEQNDAKQPEGEKPLQTEQDEEDE